MSDWLLAAIQAGICARAPAVDIALRREGIGFKYLPAEPQNERYRKYLALCLEGLANTWPGRVDAELCHSGACVRTSWQGGVPLDSTTLADTGPSRVLLQCRIPAEAGWSLWAYDRGGLHAAVNKRFGLSPVPIWMDGRLVNHGQPITGKRLVESTYLASQGERFCLSPPVFRPSQRCNLSDQPIVSALPFACGYAEWLGDPAPELETLPTAWGPWKAERDICLAFALRGRSMGDWLSGPDPVMGLAAGLIDAAMPEQKIAEDRLTLVRNRADCLLPEMTQRLTTEKETRFSAGTKHCFVGARRYLALTGHGPSRLILVADGLQLTPIPVESDIPGALAVVAESDMSQLERHIAEARHDWERLRGLIRSAPVDGT